MRPDLQLLEDLSLGFAALPWENLTKFLKKHRGTADRLRMSQEVAEDHVRYGAGGTCFSLTNTLRRLVLDLGFHAYPVMADMRHGRNIHCGLLVDLDGRHYLLDPGYLVPVPIPLEPGETFRLPLPGRILEYRTVERTGRFELHTENARGERERRYLLRPWRIPEDDFLHHWRRSFDAPGMNGLYLNRIEGDRRISAHNHNLRIDDGRNKTNEKMRGSFAGKVSERFGIDDGLAQRAYAEWERARCRRE